MLFSRGSVPGTSRRRTSHQEPMSRRASAIFFPCHAATSSPRTAGRQIPFTTVRAASAVGSSLGMLYSSSSPELVSSTLDTARMQPWEPLPVPATMTSSAADHAWEPTTCRVSLRQHHVCRYVAVLAPHVGIDGIHGMPRSG